MEQNKSTQTIKMPYRNHLDSDFSPLTSNPQEQPKLNRRPHTSPTTSKKMSQGNAREEFAPMSPYKGLPTRPHTSASSRVVFKDGNSLGPRLEAQVYASGYVSFPAYQKSTNEPQNPATENRGGARNIFVRITHCFCHGLARIGTSVQSMAQLSFQGSQRWDGECRSPTPVQIGSENDSDSLSGLSLKKPTMEKNSPGKNHERNQWTPPPFHWSSCLGKKLDDPRRRTKESATVRRKGHNRDISTPVRLVARVPKQENGGENASRPLPINPNGSIKAPLPFRPSQEFHHEGPSTTRAPPKTLRRVGSFPFPLMPAPQPILNALHQAPTGDRIQETKDEHELEYDNGNDSARAAQEEEHGTPWSGLETVPEHEERGFSPRQQSRLDLDRQFGAPLRESHKLGVIQEESTRDEDPDPYADLDHHRHRFGMRDLAVVDDFGYGNDGRDGYGLSCDGLEGCSGDVCLRHEVCAREAMAVRAC